MKSKVWLGLFGLTVAGCVPPSTQSTILTSKIYAPRPANREIKVITQIEFGKKFEEIAILNTSSGDAFLGFNLDAMLPSIKETACSLGADAILIKNVMTGNLKVPGKVFAVAIKFLD